jgi:uncharacterized protein YdeI (YjbR/CyaY-like superfamily)
VNAVYFPSAAAFRAWLEKHHRDQAELLVGFYKRHSDKPSMSWPESVDAALAFGWIDGVRRSVDGERYTIRFTPRKPTSIWSKVNIAKAEALIAAGSMAPAGLAAFERRTARRSGVYSFEQEPKKQALPPEYQALLKKNAKAWAWFSAQPPWYRRTASHWVTSAKQEATRARRLAALIADSAAGRNIKPLRRPDGKAKQRA